MTWQRTGAAPVFLLVLSVCGGGGVEPLTPELEGLRAALVELGEAPADEETEGRVETALLSVVGGPEAICTGCDLRVAVVRGPGRARVVIEVQENAAPKARMHLFYRPEPGSSTLGGWAPDRIGDHPAEFHDEQAAVWAGRVELRLFSADGEVDGQSLRGIASALPLDDLARL